MARVNVRQPHCKPLPEVRDIVRDVATGLENRYGLKSRWQGDNCIHFKRSGVGGELQIKEDEVTVYLDLGILLGGYAALIKRELQREMADRLG